MDWSMALAEVKKGNRRDFRSAKETETAMNENAIHSWIVYDSKDICKHCNYHINEHVDKQCPFEPTTFDRRHRGT